MLKLLNFFLTGSFHSHSYEKPFRVNEVKHQYSKNPVFFEYVCRCKTCGKIKVFTDKPS